MASPVLKMLCGLLLSHSNNESKTLQLPFESVTAQCNCSNIQQHTALKLFTYVSATPSAQGKLLRVCPAKQPMLKKLSVSQAECCSGNVCQLGPLSLSSYYCKPKKCACNPGVRNGPYTLFHRPSGRLGADIYIWQREHATHSHCPMSQIFVR